jgi:NAD(P)-dependent dehydrogenase (short-subunit alcohol dehydrogenase family)
MMKKVVVVTGGTAGVGRATVREFAKNGYAVAILARGQEGLDGARLEVESLGQKALAIPVDVADYEQVEAAAERVEKELGPIEVWVNNAMNSVFAPFREVDPADFKRVTEVTYLGQVYGTKAALKRMLPRDYGSIVLVGSALAFRGIPLQSAYCGSKHACQGFFDSVRSELIHDNSKVNISMVHLPAMNTPQFSWVKTSFDKKPQPMGTIYQPEVAARAVYYMSKHKRRDIYVGFSTLQTVVGNKIAPGFLDYYLAQTGFSGQLTDEQEDPNRKDNLYEPVPEDRGAHGVFDERSKAKSWQYWFSTHREYIYPGLAAFFITTLALLIKNDK